MKKENKAAKVKTTKFSISNFKYLEYIVSSLYFVILFVINLTYHKVGDYGVETDFFWMYVPEAKKILLGHLPIDPFRGPVYPLILSFIHFIIRDFFVSGIFINTLSAALFSLIIFKLSQKLYNTKKAIYIGLFTAFNPILIQYSYSCGTDMLFIVISISSIYFLLKDKEIKYSSLVISSVFAAISYLTRYNGLIIILIALIAILFFNIYKTSWKLRSILAVVYLAIFVVLILPWGIYTKNEKGQFFYNDNYLNTSYEYYAKGKVSWDQYWQGHKEIKSMKDVITSNPSYFIQKAFSNFTDNFVQDMNKLLYTKSAEETAQQNPEEKPSMGILGLLIIAGIIITFIQKPDRYQLSYFLFYLAYFGVLVLVFYSERFTLFMLPFYAVMLCNLFFVFEKIKNAKYLPLALATIYTFILLNNAYAYNNERISSGPEEVRSVADWYNSSNITKGKTIIARKPHIAFYTNMDFQVLPVFNSWEEFTDKIKRVKGDYLFLSAIEVSTRPALEQLMNPDVLKKDTSHILSKTLSPVYVNDYPRAVLYKINK